MQSHKSQPLTAQPPNPHPITHRGTTNTALLNRLTSTDLPLTHVHKTTIAPAYMRHQTQHLYHKHTICLRAPTLNCDLSHLYLNDEIINLTLQILHQQSPHRDTRHILPTFFMNSITKHDTTLHRLHRRQLETPGGPHLTHNYLLIPFNITPVHWTLLVRTADPVTGTTIISHDSLPMPNDITSTEQHLRHYDTVLKLSPGLMSSPIHNVSAVKQDDAYNCGVCVLTTAIVYLYHHDPVNFPWHSLNYPSAALHMRRIISAIIQTGKAPLLRDVSHLPVTPLSPVLPPRTQSGTPQTPAARPTTASVAHNKTLLTDNPTGNPRSYPSNRTASHPTISSTTPQIDPGSLTKIATWNINRQAAYDGPISVCQQGHIDLLHCTEPAAYLSIPGSHASLSLTRTADRAGYAVFITPNSHTYVRQNTLLPRLLTQRSSHTGRIHVFIFKGDNDAHTAILGLYAFQRGHKGHKTSKHSLPHHQTTPQQLKQDLLTIISDLKTAYPNLTLIIIGDFQHTIHNNTLHRMGKQQPPPPADILTPCLQSPIHLVSVIPSQHPTAPYHTWSSHSGSGQAGLDHILAAPEHIHQACSCGIDRELSRAYLKSDHYLIYATFATTYLRATSPRQISNAWHQLTPA